MTKMPESVPESVKRMIPNAIEYIPYSREDKGREIRLKTKKKMMEKWAKKAKKNRVSPWNDVAMKRTYLAVGETERQRKGDKSA